MHRHTFVRLLTLMLFTLGIGTGPGWAAGNRPLGTQLLNPDVSAIVDMMYHKDDARSGFNEVKENVAGFGDVHAEADAEHDHTTLENGFNMRHAELYFSADVDPYFKGSVIAGVDTESAEMEVAEIETTALPWGLKLKGGKFYSDFGYINPQHSHQWEFTDQPLIYDLLLGEHGLNDTGAQLSWLAPTPFYLLAGAESFQGNNEKLFDHHGDAPLPVHDGPRVATWWLKTGPKLSGGHGLQVGAFGVDGKHQEEHDGDEDGTVDHWLDGNNRLIGMDFVYKYTSSKAYGHGNFFLQGEYVYRTKDLDVVQHDLDPSLVGKSLEVKQDGYYVQAGYGFLPRWRLGLRMEEVGLKNKTTNPDGTREDFDASRRMTAMIDFTPTEFSRIRLQGNHGKYRVGSAWEKVSQMYLQWMVSIGAHGAHSF